MRPCRRDHVDIYFYALASAAEVEDGSNPFTDLLCELLRDFRPAGSTPVRSRVSSATSKGQLLLDHLRNDPGITVNDLADARGLCDGWRDIYAAAQRGWLTIENGRANPIGGHDLLCALPEATGDLVSSETLESVGGVTLPDEYRSHLTRARGLLAPS